MKLVYDINDMLKIWERTSSYKGRIIVGDIVPCIYGYQCLPKDIDIVIPKNVYNVPAPGKLISKVKLGDGFIEERIIDGIRVSFNVEPYWRYKDYYLSYSVVSRINGHLIRHYSLERYIAGRIKRIILMMDSSKMEDRLLIPYQLMDLIPIFCRDPYAAMRAREIVTRMGFDYSKIKMLKKHFIKAASVMAVDLLGSCSLEGILW